MYGIQKQCKVNIMFIVTNIFQMFYNQESWISVKAILDKAYMLHSNINEANLPKKRFGVFTPIPQDGLPLFSIGPRDARDEEVSHFMNSISWTVTFLIHNFSTIFESGCPMHNLVTLWSLPLSSYPLILANCTTQHIWIFSLFHLIEMHAFRYFSYIILSRWSYCLNIVIYFINTCVYIDISFEKKGKE